MDFWLRIYCFTWIVKYIVATSSDSMFSTMALGSSALLISWDKNNFSKDLADKSKIWNFKFVYGVRGKENETINSFTRYAPIQNGQVKLPGLLENTTYRVIISKMVITDFMTEWININGDWSEEVYLHFLKLFFEECKVRLGYFVERKTKFKTNSPPAKPEFFITKFDKKYSFIYLVWLPCGQKRNCQGLEPGTHFYVTYKCIESRNAYKINVTSKDEVVISFILPGKVYEIIVTSVNGDFETSSDPQEIFDKPFTSPVQSVRVDFQNGTNTTSVLISWKPPRQTADAVFSYTVCYYSPVPYEYNIMWTDYAWRGRVLDEMMCKHILAKRLTEHYQFEIKVESTAHVDTLSRVTNYKIYILPCLDEYFSRCGFVYELEYTTP